jgi:hypothetical protein
MCDSNGRLLNIKRLCPGSSYTYIRCPTLSRAQEIINNNVFTKPKILIFHCGTNDLDNSEDSKVILDLLKIIDQFKAKYPECQIILSSILPRMDNRQARISKINQKIKEECLKKPNVHFVSHTSVFASYQHFYDSKHLNDYGIKIFAKNLKTAFYQVRNKSTHMSGEQKQKEIRNHNGRNSPDPPAPTYHGNPSTQSQSYTRKPPPLMNFIPPPNFTPPQNNTKPSYYMPPQRFNLPAFNPASGFVPPSIPQSTSPRFPNYPTS